MREYTGTIGPKTDLHALIASFLFEGLLQFVNEGVVWPTKDNAQNLNLVQNLILDFIRWGTMSASNSDWFLKAMESDDTRSFLSEQRAARDEYMRQHGFTVSEQARVSVPEAIAKVREFMQRIQETEDRMSSVSVAERVRAINARCAARS